MACSRLFQIVLAGTLLLSVAAVCAASVDGLQGDIWTLKCENGFGEAVVLAQELLDLQIAEGAKLYDIAYAQVQFDLLKHIVTLGTTAQDELTYAYSLNGAIGGAHSEANYAEGMRLSREQHDIFVRHLGEQNLDAVYILGGMAFFAEMLGDYTGAMTMLNECMSGMRNLLGNGHPQVAMHLNNLAALHTNLGNYDQAEGLMREALDLRVQALGPDHPQVAQSINNLAVLSKRSGDNLKAEALYRRALSMYRNTRGPNSKSVARLLNNLGVLLYDQKDFLGAQEKLEEALALREANLGSNHADIAVSLVNVARLRADQGDFEEAQELYDRALNIRRETFGDPHPQIANTYSEMATVYSRQGNLQEAERLVRKALEIWESFFGNRHPKIADGLLQLARIQNLMNRSHDAIEQYARCLEVLEHQSGGIHPREVDARTGLAEVLQSLKRFAEAREQLERAAEKYELARVRAGSALHRDWVMQSPYSRLAAARLMDSEGALAWAAYEAGLSRKLSDLVLDLHLRPLTREQKLTQAELLRAIGRAEEKLEALRGYREGSDQEQKQYQVIREELIQAELAWSALQESVADREPVIAGRPTSLRAVQDCLEQDTALIGWLDVALSASESYSAAYIVRFQGDVVWVLLGGSTDVLSAFKEKLEVASTWPFRLGPDDELDQLAHAVWETRFSPLMEHLEGVSRLVVVPSGPMLGVPVEVLRDVSGSTVAETYTVSYTPSATIYSWLVNQSQDTARRPTKALLVGDPIFRETNEPQDAQPAQDISEDIVFRSALAGNREALRNLPPLPGTREEVERLSGILGGGVTLLGGEATETNIMELAATGQLSQFKILHFATHALVDSEQPARSALVLSRNNLPDAVESALKGEPIDDGLLTVREILSDCRLDADLVTLSACRTASTGPVVNRDYLGLAPAFLQAGARNLLVSVWPVDDQATLELMARFYTNLLDRGSEVPMRKDEALAEAKGWLRKYAALDGSRPFQHPVYWAGFVLVGTGR